MGKDILVLTFTYFLFSGCVLNPAYTEPDTQLKKQIDLYPRQAEQIKRYKKDYEDDQGYKSTYDFAGYRYEIVQQKGSSWHIGEPETLIHLGSTNYSYLHKIKMAFVCGEFSFSTPQARYKKINWKITDKIKGEDNTNNFGEFNIVFKGEHFPYRTIEIDTDKKKYIVPLEGSLIVELDVDECN